MLGYKKTTMIGVDISDGSLEFLYLGKGGVFCSTRLLLEPGIVQAGEILDAKVLADRLKLGLSKLSKQKNFPHRAVEAVISLPENKTFLYCFELPAGLSAPELEKQVRIKAQAMLPLDFAQLYWDYLAKPITGAQAIVFGAAPKKLISDYSQVFAAAGLALKMVDVESLSLARSLLHLEQAEGQIMIADLGYRSSDLSVYDAQGVLRLSVTVPLAGAQWTEALAAKLGISAEEAEKLKCAQGLVPTKQNQAYNILLPKVSQLAKGISQAIAYAEGRQKTAVKQIILAGGSSLLPGLAAYLEKELGRPLVLAKPFIKLGLKANDDPAQLFYANVAGLALLAENPHLPHLNLLAPEFHELEGSGAAATRPLWLRKLPLALALVVIFAIIAIVIIRFLSFEKTGQVPPLAPVRPSATSSNPVAPAILDNEQSAPVAPESVAAPPATATPASTAATTSVAVPPPQQAEIAATPTGFLNVRDGPSATAALVGKVYPKEVYTVLAKQADWYELKLSETTFGWVSSRYIKLINQ